LRVVECRAFRRGIGGKDRLVGRPDASANATNSDLDEVTVSLRDLAFVGDSHKRIHEH